MGSLPEAAPPGTCRQCSLGAPLPPSTEVESVTSSKSCASNQSLKAGSKGLSNLGVSNNGCPFQLYNHFWRYYINLYFEANPNLASFLTW